MGRDKGWGLRAACALPPHTLVAEYVGEVVGPQEKARRMEHYKRQGLKHTYMMTLGAAEVGGWPGGRGQRCAAGSTLHGLLLLLCSAPAALAVLQPVIVSATWQPNSPLEGVLLT